jgi:hypothetical protein
MFARNLKWTFLDKILIIKLTAELSNSPHSLKTNVSVVATELITHFRAAYNKK